LLFASMTDPDELRYRLVVLGAGKVGKTSIVQRFLSGKFSDAYRPTVEDLHSRSFIVGGTPIHLDILDTAGNLAFPAMRRLSISTAHAFLLVFAVDDSSSFDEVRGLWDQVREQRTGYQSLPCVVAANKCDLVSSRLMSLEGPGDWARAQGIETALVEVSAKLDENVVTIFRKLLQQARAASGDEDGGAHDEDPILKRHCSANAARMNPILSRLREKEQHQQPLARSRSLIRRSRKPKVKPEVNGGGDCAVS